MITIAASSLTAASAPSPQISVQVSLVVVDLPVQVHPLSIAHARFCMKSSWILQLSTWKTVKGFPNRPIGIQSDVRSAPDDFIWKETWEDEKDLILSTYWDDEILACGDCCQGRCSYSMCLNFGGEW